jgi:hypothetical protein
MTVNFFEHLLIKDFSPLLAERFNWYRQLTTLSVRYCSDATHTPYSHRRTGLGSNVIDTLISANTLRLREIALPTMETGFIGVVISGLILASAL